LIRAYKGVSCRDVAENIVSAVNIVKLLSFDHSIAANFIIPLNDTIQAVMLKCQKMAPIVIGCTCAGHEDIWGIGSINTFTLNIGK
jgi:hypothetical protein